MNASETTMKKTWRDYHTASHCISLHKYRALRKAPTSVNSPKHYSEKKDIGVSSDDNEKCY